MRRVKEKLGDQRQQHAPDGIRIVPYTTGAILSVPASVRSTRPDRRLDPLLIVLYLLLNSIRGSLVVLIALAVSLLATFIVMNWPVSAPTLMSLGGLAIPSA